MTSAYTFASAVQAYMPSYISLETFWLFTFFLQNYNFFYCNVMIFYLWPLHANSDRPIDILLLLIIPRIIHYYEKM